MEYRNERKYTIGAGSAAVMENLLRKAMKKDPNASEDFGYSTRSLYFDDLYDSAFYENEAGLDGRKKIRLRAYNGDFGFLKLEIKSKLSGYTKKERTPLSRRVARALAGGRRIPPTEFAGDRTLARVALYGRTGRLSPKVIIEYDRQVFYSPVGNVRITFDRNIRYSGRTDRFFSDNIRGRPLLSAGRLVLEVKYDGILPGYIEGLLNAGGAQPAPFSKYYLSRLAMKGKMSYDL